MALQAKMKSLKSGIDTASIGILVVGTRFLTTIRSLGFLPLLLSSGNQWLKITLRKFQLTRPPMNRVRVRHEI